jgi:SAM-dependent methyltransferase
MKRRLRLLLGLRPPRREQVELVRRAERTFHAPLGRRLRLRLAVALRVGVERVDVVEHVATSDARVDALVARLGGEGTDDATFVRSTYVDVLERQPEDEAMTHALVALQGGLRRHDFARNVVSSVEARNRERTAVGALAHLPDLTAQRPERYEVAPVLGGLLYPALRVSGPEDIDWVERMILDHGYYELPNVWQLEVDSDKQVLGQIIAAFAPQRSLELGCSSGAVLSALDQLGIAAEGIDISASSKGRAAPAVRPRIHHGDLLEVDLPSGYDVVCGFDIFEHLNPRHLDRYLGQIRDLLRPGGFVAANIPGYGHDPVYGTAYEPHFIEWRGRDTYDLWPVDPCGFPLHGHLIWATARWWVNRFSENGFTRLPEVEQAIHQRYGEWMDAISPCRRSFFVFATDPDPDEVAAVAARMAEIPALAGV